MYVNKKIILWTNNDSVCKQTKFIVFHDHNLFFIKSKPNNSKSKRRRNSQD